MESGITLIEKSSFDKFYDLVAKRFVKNYSDHSKGGDKYYEIFMFDTPSGFYPIIKASSLKHAISKIIHYREKILEDYFDLCYGLVDGSCCLLECSDIFYVVFEKNKKWKKYIKIICNDEDEIIEKGLQILLKDPDINNIVDQIICEYIKGTNEGDTFTITNLMVDKRNTVFIKQLEKISYDG